MFIHGTEKILGRMQVDIANALKALAREEGDAKSADGMIKMLGSEGLI